jgi:hypothetical protein
MSTEDDIPDNKTGDEVISSLYRKADVAVPPASLDETILAAAKQAVADQATSRGLSRVPLSGYWPVAISTAAVVLIAVILAPLLEHQNPTEDVSSTVMDEMRNTATMDEAEKAPREHAPAPNPGRLYAPIPALTPATQSQSVMEETVVEEDTAVEADRSSPAAPGPSSSSEHAEQRAQARLNAASGAPLAIFTPEMWLVKIQQLIDSGKIADAREELARFRQVHPEQELDQTLLERLQQP